MHSEGRKPALTFSTFAVTRRRGVGELGPVTPRCASTCSANYNAATKGNSPFTSFFPEGYDAKLYGNQHVTLDYRRLGADIASGRVGIIPTEHLDGSRTTGS